MKRSSSRCIFLPAMALLLGLMSSGCMTYEDYRARQDMEQREDMLIIQQDIQRLVGRVEGLELEVDRLGRSFDTLSTGQMQASHAQAESMQAQLDQINARIRGIEAAREKDRQEIVDRLSARVAQLMKTTSSKKQGASRASSSDVGYEHVVKSGESLSAIASAYGVTIKTIMDNNEIKDPNVLRAGQKLFIPQ